MSFHQVEIRVDRFRRMLRWFAEEPDDSPFNFGHFVLLSTIYQHLSTHLTPDTWGTLETRALCKMGDHLVSLYDRPLDVIDLTQDDAIRTLVWNDN
jgi:hypothetical protein